MKPQLGKTDDNDIAPVLFNPGARGGVVLVCEHASNHIPAEYAQLGLSDEVARSHIAWDPGAIGVARALSRLLDAPLIEARASRLLYDCNRPPDASDAIPAVSEIYATPGNVDLTPGERNARVAQFYQPFRALLAGAIEATAPAPVLVTVHSFTPVFHGVLRRTEIGIVHDDDARLADAMLANAARHSNRIVGRNDPYGPAEGVTHTLREHALTRGLLNVMLEIRNDLIAEPREQEELAGMLAGWIEAALDEVAPGAGTKETSCHQ